MAEYEKEHLEQAIHALNQKIDQYTFTTSSKLDMIIDLAKQMSAMQERQQRHTDDIARIEKKVDLIEEQRTTSNERLHKRLDEITENVRAQVENASSKLNSNVKDVTKDVEVLKENKNFVRGAVWIMGIVFVVLQAIGAKFINDIEHNIAARDATIAKIERSVTDVQNNLTFLQIALKK